MSLHQGLILTSLSLKANIVKFWKRLYIWISSYKFERIRFIPLACDESGILRNILGPDRVKEHGDNGDHILLCTGHYHFTDCLNLIKSVPLCLWEMSHWIITMVYKLTSVLAEKYFAVLINETECLPHESLWELSHMCKSFKTLPSAVQQKV